MTPRYPLPPPEWKDVEKVVRARLEAADMISADEAARLLDVEPVVIDDLARTRCLLAVRTPGDAWRFPAWQFTEPLCSKLPTIVDALDLDGWAALAWLETPLGGRNGLTPRSAVEQGQASRVVLLARTEGT
jgi:hypothetical protein